MKKYNEKIANEFSLRLASADWNNKMQARIEAERKDRFHLRVQVMAIVSALFIGAVAITSHWLDESAERQHLYATIEEAAGGLQMQVSFSE